jgi:uncharacterized membrane protein YfcA
MIVIAIIVLIALYYAMRSPRDMEEQHGGAVDTPAKRAGLMAGTFVFMLTVGGGMLFMLWLLVNVAEVAR